MNAEKILVILLRFGGVLTGLALLAVFMPEEWMAASHRALGMGEMPRAPLVDYLNRTLSALYAYHGGLLLTIATDVRRHRRLVVFVGWANLVFGALVLAIDLGAPMPVLWTWSEGPAIVVLGAAVLLLVRRVPRG